MKKTSHWNNLYRGVMDYSTLDTLNIQLKRTVILSKLCFCQERLDQITVEVPSSLVFYDSVIIQYLVYLDI